MKVMTVWSSTSYSQLGSPTYTTAGGQVEVCFACSAYNNGNSGCTAIIGVTLSIGGVAMVATRWANSPQQHVTLVPVSQVLKLEAGTYPISVNSATASTTIDANDYFTLTLREF